MDFDPLATIAHHAEALLLAADGNLEAPVEGCPGWVVRDLVAHLRDVHWFWATVVEERLLAPMDGDGPTWSADTLLADAREQAERLVRVLSEADPGAAVWTWATQQDVAFVLRHQVQEAAVHHWDAAHAAGLAWSMDPAAAADAIEECLTFSVPSAGSLGGYLTLRAEDVGTSWTVADGAEPGTVCWTREPGAVAVTATAPELLLWLYERVPLDTSAVPAGVVERFHALGAED